MPPAAFQTFRSEAPSLFVRRQNAPDRESMESRRTAHRVSAHAPMVSSALVMVNDAEPSVRYLCLVTAMLLVLVAFAARKQSALESESAGRLSVCRSSACWNSYRSGSR